MVNRIITKGKNFLTEPQGSVLSAATVIMFMIVVSRILGLLRQRVLAHFFAPAELSLFFAAFRLPDLIFEVLVFGTFSSAFIPVFTKSLKNGKEEAWDTASRVANIGLLIFLFFAILFGIFAREIYSFVAPGFSIVETEKIASLARILFLAQAFFITSYVLTGVLESLRRFLVPALAPIFYNIGIILGTVFLAPSQELTAPAIGVVIGAFSHFAIQIPLALKLGFRFRFSIKADDRVRKIGKLALPRIVDLSFQQVAKTVELYLASLISTASYTYFTFANTLQLLPVGLFGVSLAKATLPTLAHQGEDLHEFKKTLLTSLSQIVFLVSPIAAILIVLRIPLVRLIFGTDIFDWAATVETGKVLSAFAIGVVFQSAIAVLARAFYALHDTKTPVGVSLVSIAITVILDFILVRGLGIPVWALAFSFSIGSIVQAIFLYYLLSKRLKDNFLSLNSLIPYGKSAVATISSALVMFFLLKFFDRSAWVKRLSFLSSIDAANIPFQRFVLDTRYTVNLLVLTILVATVGILVYVGISYLLKSKELSTLVALLKRAVGPEKALPPPPTDTELI
ncbi:murein biosynthesis integral membrane protein MurJ [Candidatus Woesebacteria bacterium]|nr:murein biosynthesis integral membrane protein MurJ [Candidatus Woesebacteria bacterium]